MKAVVLGGSMSVVAAAIAGWALTRGLAGVAFAFPVAAGAWLLLDALTGDNASDNEPTGNDRSEPESERR